MKRVYSIGHSTRSILDFIGILEKYCIKTLVDIRTVPRSKRNPQFNEDSLSTSLTVGGITYVHLKELGGFRKPLQDSINFGWRNESFRGYADYMQSTEFETGLKRLIDLIESGDTVSFMCAEAVPWRCHRSLVGDSLVVRGIEVIDILDERYSKPHVLTSWAKVDGLQITYPSPNAKITSGDEVQSSAC
ncbi:MAG TPA: DUF488 domain-containing protein [Nitrososphaerales archaeon]|nr:DUF488 domain-containing protein [Nitrososphaerales archaeon]